MWDAGALQAVQHAETPHRGPQLRSGSPVTLRGATLGDKGQSPEVTQRTHLWDGLETEKRRNGQTQKCQGLGTRVRA